MTSTNFMSGLGENNKTSSKVLRPPGGGSSDIFGKDSAPATPRSAMRNHMASNIFGSTQDAAVKSSGDSARRMQKNIDSSYSRLFGEPERPFTPAKNHMKSSIPIGAVEGKDSSSKILNNKNTMNGSSSSSQQQINGYEKNGKIENGDQQNNVTKSEKHEEISLINSDGPTETTLLTPRTAINSQRIDKPIIKENGYAFDEISETKNIPNGNDIKIINDVNSPPSLTNNNNNNNNSHGLKPVEINGNISENTSSTDSSTITSSAVSPALSNASNASNNNIRLNSARSPRNSSRNPVTGMGIEPDDPRPRRMANRRDGNPVTGEGYKPAGAEINTSIPCLNGANQVINKNRIPPGGYSSGLW